MLTLLAVLALMSTDPDAATPEGGSPAKTKDDATLQAEGVHRAKYDEVVRGFSLRIPVGVFTYLTPVKNTADGTSRDYGPGTMMGLELAYDVARIFDIGGFVYYLQSPQTGSNPIQYDLSSIFGGIMGRVSFFSTERLFIGARVGVGYGTQDNLVEKRQQGVVALVAPTIEYYTKLRHMSLALDVGVTVWPMLAPIAIGLSVVPAVRYTF